MKIKHYSNSVLCDLSHNRFRCVFDIVEWENKKEIKNLSFVNLLHTKITSQVMSEKTARTVGEMFIKIADELKKVE